MDFPRITIVTPSYNQGKFLEDTILSVLSQDYPNLEFIVIDGGSTDESLNIIKKYSSRLNYWQSCPDKGQTDAIAQGFFRATGIIFNWLNSDDMLAPGALEHISIMAKRAPQASIYAAATESYYDGHFESGRIKTVPCNLNIKSLLLISGGPIHRHQTGIFFKRDIYEKIGGFTKNYEYCMDLDIYLRMLENGAIVEYDSNTVAYSCMHSESKTQGIKSHAVSTVREYIEISNSVGSRLNLSPNHKAHLRTLLGTAIYGVFKGHWTESFYSIKLAFEISNLKFILREVLHLAKNKILKNPK